MARNKIYTQEFKNTIVELHHSGKSLDELSNEYGISKSTIYGWVKKAKPITIDNGTTISSEDYRKFLKKMKTLEEENQILKKAMAIFAKD